MYLETENNNLVNELILNFPSTYIKYDDISLNKIELTSYPNDYGTSSPNPNLGANIYRKDLDYINIEKAWDISTGVGVKIGISDSRINITDNDYVGKVSFVNPFYTQYLPYVNDILYNHGTATAGIAAARGNNGYGSTGVCYNCDIIGTSYTNYNNLLLLAQSGVKVINMSWVSANLDNASGYPSEQLLIDKLVNVYGVVLVATAGNVNSFQNANNYYCDTGGQSGPNYVGIRYCFPATYKGVISVSGINHYNDIIKPLIPNQAIDPSYCCTSPTGNVCFIGMADSVSDTVNGSDPNNPVGIIYSGYPNYCNIGTANQYISSVDGLNISYATNPEVDILAPTNLTFRFDYFAEQGIISYLGGGTSSASPFVAGAAALIVGANNCLTPYEVDTVLKLTTKDVPSLPINQNFNGQIGAGALNVGDAVIFANEIKKINGNAFIKNHIFNRFDFNLLKISNKLTLSNITLKDNCKAIFKTKNQINLLPGTKLSPNSNGSVYLSIDSNISNSCTTVSIPTPRIGSNTNNLIDNAKNINLVPNPNNGIFEIFNLKDNFFDNDIVSVEIFDLKGIVLFNKENDINSLSNTKFDFSNLASGVYILRLSSNSLTHEIKFIKN